MSPWLRGGAVGQPPNSDDPAAPEAAEVTTCAVSVTPPSVQTRARQAWPWATHSPGPRAAGLRRAPAFQVARRMQVALGGDGAAVISPAATSQPSAGQGRWAFRSLSQGRRPLSRVSTVPGAGDLPASGGAPALGG